MFDINPQTQFSHLRELETKLTQPVTIRPTPKLPRGADRLISVVGILMVAGSVAAIALA